MSMAGINAARAARAIRRTTLLGVFTASALGAGCATAEPYNPGRLAAADRNSVAGLCTNVIGIRPGIEQFNGCLEALSAAAGDRARSGALVTAERDCMNGGLAPASAGLAECELDRSRATGERGSYNSTIVPVLLTPSTFPSQSYFSASNAEVHRREETACARLGLEPTGASFGRCVASLSASLFAADNPTH